MRNTAAGEYRTGERFSEAALDRISPAVGQHDDEKAIGQTVQCSPARSGPWKTKPIRKAV